MKFLQKHLAAKRYLNENIVPIAEQSAGKASSKLVLPANAGRASFILTNHSNTCIMELEIFCP